MQEEYSTRSLTGHVTVSIYVPTDSACCASCRVRMRVSIRMVLDNSRYIYRENGT